MGVSVYVECSADRAALMKAMAKAQGGFTPVVKDSKGPYGLFASLDSMISATRPALAANGLSVMQPPMPIPDDRGRLWAITELCHESGQWYRCGTPVERHPNPQKTLAEFKYMRRMSYSGVLCLSDTDDLDGEGLTKEPADAKATAVRMWEGRIEQCDDPKKLEEVILGISQAKASGKLATEAGQVLMSTAVDKRRKLTQAKPQAQPQRRGNPK